MKVAIIGSRSFDKPEHYLLMLDKCDAILSSQTKVHIFSGGADGADTLAYRYAVKRGHLFTCIPARWDDIDGRNENEIGETKEGRKYWKKAGIARNTKLVDEVDAVIAFWDGKSTGTMDAIGKAKRKGIPIREIRFK